jgi:hypothetical protein
MGGTAVQVISPVADDRTIDSRVCLLPARALAAAVRPDKSDRRD